MCTRPMFRVMANLLAGMEEARTATDPTRQKEAERWATRLDELVISIESNWPAASGYGAWILPLKLGESTSDRLVFHMEHMRTSDSKPTKHKVTVVACLIDQFCMRTTGHNTNDEKAMIEGALRQALLTEIKG